MTHAGCRLTEWPPEGDPMPARLASAAKAMSCAGQATRARCGARRMSPAQADMSRATSPARPACRPRTFSGPASHSPGTLHEWHWSVTRTGESPRSRLSSRLRSADPCPFQRRSALDETPCRTMVTPEGRGSWPGPLPGPCRRGARITPAVERRRSPTCHLPSDASVHHLEARTRPFASGGHEHGLGPLPPSHWSQ